MSSPLFLQQTCGLFRLTWIVFVMGGMWPYSCCFVGCCLQYLFKVACSILVQLPSSFFSIRLVSVHVVHPYNSIDTTVAWKKLRFIKMNPHMIENGINEFVQNIKEDIFCFKFFLTVLMPL